VDHSSLSLTLSLSFSFTKIWGACGIGESVGFVLPFFLSHLGIYNEDFTLFDANRVGRFDNIFVSNDNQFGSKVRGICHR
jgi:hypothetical protein